MKSMRSSSWIERLLGLDPVLPAPHVFALDRHELRYGSFHRTPQGWVFETSRREPLPEGLMAAGVLGGPLRAPKLLWELLQRFVATVPGPIAEASLVLPDDWLRIVFTESAELPRGRKERDEVLRFKLKRLVPFRVEELRLAATEVTPFPHQQEPKRLLIGFAIETLMAQLEDAFLGVGIELGQITNNTLAILAGLEPLVAADELAALVLVEPEGYTLSYLYGGELLLYRYKSYGEETAAGDERHGAADAGAVRRDLRLTRTFLGERFPQRRLSRVFLAAPPAGEASWLDRLADELDAAAEPLGFEHFSLARTQASESWQVTGPLLGAASIEVS
jgi:hypothetical protein